MSGTRESCKCAECASYCRHKPGWFKPGEAERAAELKGMTLTDFFEKYLAVDYYAATPNNNLKNDLFLLSPATTEIEAGTEFPYEPRGTCVFFKNGLCEIHTAKPFECKMSFHGDGEIGPKDTDRHLNVAKSWLNHQPQIKLFLGRKPKVSDADFMDWVSLLVPKV